ncbi:MAG: protein phosphatase 2C domain-containing protein [Elainellaceae cyanobacterium]
MGQSSLGCTVGNAIHGASPQQVCMLQCPNQNCQAPNAESNRFCHRCHVPLPKRYLLGIGVVGDRLSAGAVISERYQYKGDRVFFDLQPGVPPAEKGALPAAVHPYLRLVQYRLHLPQLYDWLDDVRETETGRLLLLYDAAIYCPSVYTDGQSFSGKPPIVGKRKLPTSKSKPKESKGIDPDAGSESARPRPLPQIADLWKDASTWRRLNWLWQIAQLWHPLTQEQVASSLLSPQLLRGEGALVRLLELRSDAAKSRPTLAQLGQLWRRWIGPDAADSRFFTSLCDQLINGKIEHPDQLISVIEAAVARLGPSRSQSIQLTTQTDQGPSRSRNEDACFPPSNSLLTYPSTEASQGTLSSADPVDEPVVIVCDGIGGHQGGDVASQLAIHSICDHLIDPPSISTDGPLGTFQHLSDAIYDANTLISQRNDGEQRRDRQRMGTTVVMALVEDYNCYISHIGDSRAYWITRWGCHQITLDDDVASREVRMGYATHPDAVHRPGAGSLVQALGMSSSTSLHPTVQRLMLDGTGLLLLCSDGLSDNDLVETFWRSILLPALSGELELTAARQALVDTANTQNGYDNVTVGLLQWQVIPPSPDAAAALTLESPTNQAIAPSTRLQSGQGVAVSASPSQAGRFSSAEPDGRATVDDDAPPVPITPMGLNVDLRRPASVVPLLIGIVLLLGIGGLLIYLLVPSVGNRVSRRLNPSADGTNSSEPFSSGGEGTDGEPSALRDRRVPLMVGVVLRIGDPAATDASPLPAYIEPISPEGLDRLGEPANPEAAVPPPENISSPQAAPAPEPVGYLVPGMTAQIKERSEFSQAVWWIKLEVCQPSNAPTDETDTSSAIEAQPLLRPGQSAWVPESALTSAQLVSSRVEAADGCLPPPPEASPEAFPPGTSSPE